MDSYGALRPILFRLDPERAHRVTLRLLALAGAIPAVRSGLRRIFLVPDLRQDIEVFGLKFANPVGLAAGYDKNGLAIHGLACLGFGHLELGTVTLKPQTGNPAPRMFRLEEDQALINRLGFPNDGVRRLLTRLENRPSGVRIGINIGKSTETPLDEAAQDYVRLLELVYDQADYIAVNVSSPNTIGLRRLQGRRLLEGVVGGLATTRQQLVRKSGKWLPLLVKLSPDMEAPELEEAIPVILAAGMDGVLLTNTTTARSGLSSPHRAERGGLSGAPLAQRSTEMIRTVNRMSGDRLPVIGVGGILGPQQAREKLASGASLIQLYTGLVYRGPGLVREILSDLR